MSETITISNTMSLSGGIIETGAGTPILEVVPPSIINSNGTTSSSNYQIVVEDPQSGGSSGTGSTGGSTGTGSGNNGGSNGGSTGGGSTGGSSGGSTGGTGGGGTGGPATLTGGGDGANGDSGGGSGGNSPASTCSAGDPGDNPPNQQYIAVTKLTPSALADDLANILNAASKVYYDLGLGYAQAVGADSATLETAASVANADINLGLSTTTVIEAKADVVGDFLATVVEGLAEATADAIGGVLGALAIAAVKLGELAETVVSDFEDLESLINSLVSLFNDATQQASSESGGSSSNDHSSGANGSGANNCSPRHDPLIIDLTGNGLNLTPLANSNTYFDFNGDGFSVNTAWIGSGTAFLVIQSSNPAFGVSIGDGYELLGTGTETGYEILQSLITNNAGTISASDSIYSELAVWQDTNGDGIAQASEISSLAAAGVESISLNTTAVNETIDLSNISEVSSVTMADGQVNQIGEVNLASYNAYSDYTGTYTLTSQILALPDVKGYGLLPDLHIEMSSDPALVTMVQDLATSPPDTVTGYDEAVQAIMYEWASVNNVAPSAGNIVDGQKVDFLSLYTDEPDPFSTNPSVGPAPWFIGQAIALSASWADAFDEIEARLLVQTNSTFEATFSVSPGTDLLMPTTNYATSINAIAAGAPTDLADQVNYWVQALVIISQSIGDYIQNAPIDTADILSSVSSKIPFFISPDVLDAALSGKLTYFEMSALNNVVYGTAGSDLFDVSQSNMTIEGFGGGDEIIVNPGVTNLEINEVENNPSNSNVLFMAPGIKEKDVVVSVDTSGDIYLTYDAEGDQIKLDNMVFGPTSGDEQGPLHTSLPYTPTTEFGVQEIIFSDGTTWTSQQVLDMLQTVGSPTESTLVVGAGTLTLDPNGYAHDIVGQDGADTIIYDTGYGNLTINETNALGAEQSVLQFGAGISAREILASSDASGDLVLTLGTTGTEITLTGMAQSSSDGVAAATFADGTTLTARQLLSAAGIGSAGNTVLYANADTTVLDPNGYAHEVVGVTAGQTVVYNEGYGDLALSQTDGSGVLAFGSGVSETDIAISQDAQGDIVLTDLTTGATISVTSMGANGYGIGEVTFTDGTTWTASQILAAADTGSINNQYLYAHAGYNLFTLNGYAHYVQGGGGVHTILYNPGDGNLTINDVGNAGLFGAYPVEGTLQFGSGILESDVSVSGTSNGSVILTIGSTGSQITVENQLDGENYGFFANDYGLAEITFADGTTWSIQQIANMAEVGSADNSTIYGSSEVGTIDPAGFAHVIDGTGAASTVIYNEGYGPLTINENDDSPLTTIQMGAEISESDITAVNLGNDNFAINVGSTTDSITINNFAQLGAVAFADGTTWSPATILALADIGSVPNETLTGDAASNFFDPNGFAHEVNNLYGNGTDTIVYGEDYGNLEIDESTQYGDTGYLPNQNVLQFGSGITEADVSVAQDSNGDILLYVGGTSDQITLTSMLSNPPSDSQTGTQQYGVGSVVFADGTTWTAQQVLAMSETGNSYNQTLSATAAAYVYSNGTFGYVPYDTTFNPNGYAQVINGSGGADTINYGSGDGDLTINEDALSGTEASVLNFGEGISEGEILIGQQNGNLILQVGSFADQITLTGMANDPEVPFSSYLTSSGVGSIVFADGTTWSSGYVLSQLDNGSSINTVLSGEPGDNTFDPRGFAHLIEATGADFGPSTYIYNAGYGELTIEQFSGQSTAQGVVQFGASIFPSDISVGADSNGGVILTAGNSDNQITISGMLESPLEAIANATFADGTTWSAQQILSMADIGSADNTTLYAGYEPNVFDPAGFAHLIEDNGDSTILYDQGYGNLEIQPVGLSSGGSGASGGSHNDESTLELGAGISVRDVSFAFNNQGGIVMTVAPDDSQITFDNAETDGTPSIVFSNGMTLSSQQIIYAAQTEGEGNAVVLYGGQGADTLVPGGFYNFIQGESGADTIQYALGDGNLTINEQSSQGPEQSILQFGSGISASDLSVSGDAYGDMIVTIGTVQNQVTLYNMLDGTSLGVSEFLFADGTSLSAQELVAAAQIGSPDNTTLYADGGVNTLVPNGYAHTVVDYSGGTDTITYTNTDGNLNIQEYNPVGAEQSVLAFGSGISESDISVSGDSYGITLTVEGTGSQIYLSGMAYSPNYGIGSISFANGATLSSQQIIDAALANQSGAPNILYGGPGTDTLSPAGFYQVVQGEGGADTILYGIGDGNLTINEQSSLGAEQSILQFGTGISVADISFAGDPSGDVVLTVGIAESQITLSGMLSGTSFGVSELLFSDGSTLSAEQVIDAAQTGSPYNTTLYADGAVNTLVPDGYAHTIVDTSGGADTITYASGDGNLYIKEYSPTNAEQSVLAFGSGITEGDISFSQNGYGVTLTDRGTGSEIYLAGMAATQYYGVGSVVFSNGTTLSSNEVMDAARGQLGGVLYGGQGADTLAPSGFYSVVQGEGGADTILYNLGDGNLTINEQNSAGVEESIIQFGTGISVSDLSFAEDSSGDIILTIGTAQNQITLTGMLSGPSFGVTGLLFVDGTTLSAQQIITAAQIGSPGNTTLYANGGINTLVPGGYAHSIVDYSGGSDTISYSPGDGNLSIEEYNLSGTEQSVLAFGVGISEGDISASGDGYNVTLTVGNTGAQIFLSGMDYSPDDGVGSVTFADGTTWSSQQVLSLLDIGSPTNTFLQADGGNNTFDSQGYAQAITDYGGGADTIIYGQHYGNISIYEYNYSGPEQSVLQFGSGISESNVTVSEDSYGDILLNVGSSGSQIDLYNMAASANWGVGSITFSDGTTWNVGQIFALLDTGSPTRTTLTAQYGNNVFNPDGYADLIIGSGQADVINYNLGDGNLTIDEPSSGNSSQATLVFGSGITESDISISEDFLGTYLTISGQNSVITLAGDGYVGVGSVVFSDGTTWNSNQLLEFLDVGSLANTNLTNHLQNNTFDPNGFAHSVTDDAGGADTILYNAGYGNLQVNEENYYGAEQSVLQFGTGISEGEISVSEDGNSDVILTVGSTGAQIVLAGMADSVHDGVGSVVFSDGTTWTAQQILAMNQEGTAGTSVLYGGYGNGSFDPAAFVHTIDGGSGANLILYSAGDGDLTINETAASDQQSVLRFGNGISSSEIEAVGDTSGDIILTIATLGTQITLTGMLENSLAGVGSLVFSDGSTLSAQQLVTMADTGSTINTTLYSNDFGVGIVPNGPAHIVDGGGESNVIDYEAGDGNLTISETSDEYAPGYYYINGTVILGPSGEPVADVLAFGTGISEGDISASSPNGTDLVLTVGTTDNQITLSNMLISGQSTGSGITAYYGISELTFADGTTLTAQQVIGLLDTGSAQNTTLTAGAGTNTLDPGGYAHVINGDGGTDTIIYNQGYGDLTINEVDSNGPEESILQIGSAILSNDIAISGDAAGDVLLTDTASGNMITLTGMLDTGVNGVSYGVGSIVFVGSMTLTAAQIIADAETGSPMNATLYAGGGNTTFQPDGYAQVVDGNGGADTIIYTSTQSSIQINEKNPNGAEQSVLQLGSGVSAADLTITTDGYGDVLIGLGSLDGQIDLTNMLSGTEYGIGSIEFVDGTTLSAQQIDAATGTAVEANTTLYATLANETLDTKGYMDAVQGNGGADTIIYNAGYGNLQITEQNPTDPEQSVLQFGTGISEADVAVSQDQNGDIILGIGTPAAQITIVGMVSSDQNGVAAVEFADGTTWTAQQIIAMTEVGSAINTTLTAGPGNNVFNPNGYANLVDGDGGADTIIYDQGYGKVTVNEENQTGPEQTVLQFGTGITRAELSVSQDSFGDVILTIGTAGDQVVLSNMIDSGQNGISFGIGSATFVDGTTLAGQQLISMAETGSADNTVLRAGPDGDTIDPNGYAHLVEGGGGTNTIIYDQGYGDLTINEQTTSGTEQSVLQFGSGISTADLSETIDVAGDVILTVGPSNDQITLSGMANGLTYGIGEAVFTDGTTLTASQIIALASLPAGTLASTIAGAVGSLTTTDEVAITPFASIVITDSNAGAPVETVTVSLSSLANGSLSDPNAATDGATLSNGVFTVTGSAADVTSVLDALQFVPAAHEVAPGQSVTTSLTLTDENSSGLVTNASTSLIVTAVNDAPAIAGAQGGQTTTDEASLNPFSGVVISDPDAGVTDTVTITLTGTSGLATDADGTLSGAGLTEISTGICTLAATSPAILTSELEALTFSPTTHQVAPGGTVTTGFTLAVSQNGLTSTDTATSVIAVAVDDATVLSGVPSGLSTTDEASLALFSGVSVSDPDTDVTEAATITLTGSSGIPTDADGVLSGGGLTEVSAGIYTLAAATPASLTAELDALNFAPTAHQVTPGGTITTGVSLKLTQGGITSADGTFAITATAVNDAPAISGTAAGQVVTDEASLLPFSDVIISDPDAGATETATITLTGTSGLATDADGVLSGIGLTKIGTGVYALAVTTPGSLTAELEALTFSPTAHQVAPGNTVTTTMSLAVTQDGLVATDSSTSVIATATNDAPIISGAVAGQTTTDETSLLPFAGVIISNPDTGVTDSMTITLTGTGGLATDADGLLSGTGLTKIGTGLYTLAAASPASLTAELEALSFAPAAHQVAPGGTVATGFDLAVTQNGLTSTSTVTSVIATAVNDAPVIAGAVAGQATTDEESLNPFFGVTINDPDMGVTETATITLTGTNGLATDADGTLSGAGLTKTGTGIYALAVATPASLTSELEALTFTPTAHQVSPGGTVTTDFDLAVTQNGVTSTNTATSVIATATAATIISNGTLYALESGLTLNTGGTIHVVNGSSFANTIDYNKGYGALTIEDSNPSGAEQSILQLGSGISEGVLTVSSDASGDVILKDGVSGDQITLTGMLNSLDAGVGSVAFVDGTSWTASEIVELAELQMSGTTPGDYSLAFGSGQKTISSAGVFVIGAGITKSSVVFQSNNRNGNLTIALVGANAQLTGDSITINGYWWNYRGQATVLFPDGSTLSVGSQVINTWIGTATQTSLAGSDFSPNLFDLGPGGDQVTLGATYDGGNGQNTLEFGYGDGAVTVTPDGASETIAFGAGILSSNVAFESNNNNGNLTIELLDSNGQPTGDSMTIAGYWWNSSGTNLAVFANGTTLAINHQLTNIWIGSATQTTLIGSDFSPNLFVLGAGGDTITLGANYDGGNGQNTIDFGYGDGAVTVNPNEAGGTIAFGAGIIASDVIFESNNNSGNLTIELLGSNGQPTGDSMTIDGYWWNGKGLNTAVFSNGSTLAINNSLANTWIGTSTQTNLVGSDFSPNVFDLAPGGDQVTLGATYDGGNGQNIVNFGIGDGGVTLTGNNGLATVDLAAGIGLTDVTLSTDSSGDIVLALSNGTDKLIVSDGMYSSAFQQLDFSNGTTLSHSQILYTAETGTTGNDTITVPSGAEVIDGRGGNDVINGGAGYDTYIFRQGYGNLTINNAAGGGTAANGELDFGPGITEQDLWFSRSGNNLDINVLGSTSQIMIDNWFSSNAGAQLSEIKVYDGLEIDTGLSQLVAAMAAFSAEDTGFNPETATQMPTDANLQAAIAATWHH